MSFFPGEKLRYAETHFKFRLPWSLLFKPWPEIIFDAPFQFVPGVKPALWIVVHDADRFPTRIEEIHIAIEGNGERREKRISLNLDIFKAFEFHPVELENLEPGTYNISVTATAVRLRKDSREIQSDKAGKILRKNFTRWNLPGLKPEPLKVQVLAENPPKAPGYAVGEMHCHTYYSCDHVEYGASPAVLQMAGKAVGLDFISCTDHAYDFAFTEEDYTKEAPSPVPRFTSLQKEIEKLNEDGSYGNLPFMLAGEEVSAGNSKGENVHVTVLAPESYLPGLGDCGRYWLENRPTRKITQLLEMTKAHCFAAHPFQQMGLLEKFIFRRGYWEEKDLHLDKIHSIRGIQFWNGLRDEGFLLGREFWIKELGKENYLLPIGGNDAHGDLNNTTAVSMPLLTLKNSRDHIFGKVRTAISIAGPQTNSSTRDGENSAVSKGVDKIKDKLSVQALNTAFDGDNCYITDGPALWWERGEGNCKNQIHFHARNTEDFGGCFRYIRIYGRRRLPNGKLSQDEEVCMESQVAARMVTDITVNFDNFAYLRAECETASGKFAMTSAARKV